MTELHLHLMNAPLSTLDGAPITRLVIRDRSLATGLHPVPAGLPLTDLVLDNRPPDRNLRGVERLQALTHIEFFGTPDREELDALGRLPELTSLTVHQPETVDDLVHLPALQSLTVDGVPAARRPEVLAALARAEQLTVTLDGVALGCHPPRAS